MRRVALLSAFCVCVFSAHCSRQKNAQDQFFDSNGVRIRYQVSGRGPAVVLIHGFGETLERWKQVVPVLSPHFQVIAMDVRGHGRSSKPHDPASYGTELAGDIVRLLRHLGIAKAHIVGYSMGALVALDFAIEHPQHAASVVLGGAGWNPPEAVQEFKQQAEAFEQGRFPAREGDDPQALAALLRGIRTLSEQQVRSIKTPLAVLIGSNDRFMPNVRRLSRVQPAMQVVEIPGADHASALNHPQFPAALLTFLRKESG